MKGLSINHYITPNGYPVERFLDDCAAAGAAGVGLTERALDEVPLPAMRQMLRDRNLRVTSVNSAGFFLWGDPDRARRQAEINVALIEAAAELEADTLVTIGGGVLDRGEARRGDLEVARREVEEALPALAEAAQVRGVRLGLEPMHPWRIASKSTLNTLAQTEAIVARHPGVGFAVDFFHSWWDPELDAAIQRSLRNITLVQLTGVAQPVGDGLLPTRCAMSDGLVDVGALIAKFEAAGYSGNYEFEIFAPDLGSVSVPDAIKRAVSDFNTYMTT